MTDWKQIAIELYRDGMPKHLIREKLECTVTELNNWLLDEPVPTFVTHPSARISPARKAGIALLKKGLPAKEVHKRLRRMGLDAAESTVKVWRSYVQGPVNQRVDRAVVSEIIKSMPDAMPYEVRATYILRTGERPSRQAIAHWVKKLRAAA